MMSLPDSFDEDHAQVCLIRKYRTTNGEGQKTNYSFFKIGVSKDISNEIKKWLQESFKSIEGKEIIDYNPSVELEDLEKIDLDVLDVWKEFREKAFSGINNHEVDLKTLKNNLSGIIIFMKNGNKVYGQIRKATPGNVLYQKGLYKLYFNGEKFNALQEEQGISLHKKADFIFCMDDKSSNGIILDKGNFKAIFDLWEEYRKKSLENAKQIKLFKDSSYADSFYETVGEDRIIQKMLINPAFETYLDEMNYSDLFALKTEVPGINFELNKETKDFILPQGKEKEAIRDLIKTISGRFSRSINNKHIIENSGVRRVLK